MTIKVNVLTEKVSNLEQSEKNTIINYEKDKLKSI